MKILFIIAALLLPNISIANERILVEMYTSKLCPACPAAEELVKDMAINHRTKYIPIAYHVDTWDSAKARDEFSSSVFTSMQNEYDQNNVQYYRGKGTPRAIVAGEYHAHGARFDQIEYAAKDYIKNFKQLNLEHKISGDNIEITIPKSLLNSNIQANFVGFAEKLKSVTQRGSNRGKTEDYYNVAESIEVFDIEKATYNLTKPNSTYWAFYIKDKQSKNILAIASNY